MSDGGMTSFKYDCTYCGEEGVIGTLSGHICDEVDWMRRSDYKDECIADFKAKMAEAKKLILDDGERIKTRDIKIAELEAAIVKRDEMYQEAFAETGGLLAKVHFVHKSDRLEKENKELEAKLADAHTVMRKAVYLAEIDKWPDRYPLVFSEMCRIVGPPTEDK